MRWALNVCRAAVLPLPIGWTILIYAILVASAAVPVPARGETTAIAASVVPEGDRAIFTLDLTRGIKAEIFTLPDPWRVVIELEGVTFNLPAGTGEPARGATGGARLQLPLVTAFRFGAFSGAKSRIVIDTSRPAVVARADMTNVATGVRLAVTLAATDAASFGAGTGAGRQRQLETASTGSPAPTAKPHASPPGPEAPQRSGGRPVVMIDPGHGGVDPGAVGAGNTTEKSVVLSVAWQLKRALDATGRYDVRMTRSTDVFVSLERRVILAEEARADLFLSLHADAIEDAVMAQSTSGASIYTLSDRASDDRSRKMAEKENAADLVAGIGSRNIDTPDEVKGILSDLWARENSGLSHMFSKSLVGSLGRMKALGRQPERSAAFRVLKQAHAPAVLIELGFLSNAAEEVKIASLAWQKQIGAAIAAAVDTYFERRKSASFAAPGPTSVAPVSPGGLPP